MFAALCSVWSKGGYFFGGYMDKGIFYCVGVGPGDKELITIKALHALQRADIIAVPRMKNGESTAYGIVKDYIGGKDIINFHTPMSKDFAALDKNYANIAKTIAALLDSGKSVAFITLGDPGVYSTAMQVNADIAAMGYKTEVIPGITSFCAAAARLNISLCERDEPLVVLPASYSGTADDLRHKGTKVLMKAGRAIIDVKDMLAKEGMLDKASMVECCGMENEKIYKSLSEPSLSDTNSYFSIIIVKDNG